MERWPDFFLVGVKKCGTTSLRTYLRQTPGVFVPERDDFNYFLSEEWKKKLPRKARKTIKKENYLAFFKDVNKGAVAGESSGLYSIDPQNPQLIGKVNPEAKILISLRDPVERIYSQYLHRRYKGGELLSFHDVIHSSQNGPTQPTTYLTFSYYYDQVKRYFDFFGRAQVKVIIFEEFIKDTRIGMKDILKFLGVNSEPPDSVDKIYNPFFMPKLGIASRIFDSQLRATVWNLKQKGLLPDFIPKNLKKVLPKTDQKLEMSTDDRKFLEGLFREDIIKLEGLLARKLPWLEKWNNPVTKKTKDTLKKSMV